MWGPEGIPNTAPLNCSGCAAVRSTSAQRESAHVRKAARHTRRFIYFGFEPQRGGGNMGDGLDVPTPRLDAMDAVATPVVPTNTANTRPARMLDAGNVRSKIFFCVLQNHNCKRTGVVYALVVDRNFAYSGMPSLEMLPSGDSRATRSSGFSSRVSLDIKSSIRFGMPPGRVRTHARTHA